jgi:hypothetical protein
MSDHKQSTDTPETDFGDMAGVLFRLRCALEDEAAPIRHPLDDDLRALIRAYEAAALALGACREDFVQLM